MSDRYGSQAPCTAPELLLKLVLTGTQSHYEHRGIIDDKRLEHLLHAGKQVLFKSHQESDVRQNLGFSPAVWQGLTSVLSAAIPELESLCFIYKRTNPDIYNNSSSELVAANCFTLVKEIERLNDLCTIARNLLATTKRAQNLAADRGFDQQILKLIDVCVKVTARGFDGTNVRVEERHQRVCNLFKRLLITCLQFLHNFIMHNEHRKLVLWLDLFGNAAHQSLTASGRDMETGAEHETHQENLEQSPEAEESKNMSASDLAEEETRFATGKLSFSPAYTIDDVSTLFETMTSGEKVDQKTQDAARALMQRIRSDMESVCGMKVEELDEDPKLLFEFGAALRAQLTTASAVPETEPDEVPQAPPDDKSVKSHKNGHWPGLPDITTYGNLLVEQEINKDDLLMPRTSKSAAETLQEAKDELMARLQDTPPLSERHDFEAGCEGGHVVEGEIDDEIPDSVEESVEDDEEEDEDEDDYRESNDQERGLLTDVPLVLGPTEIEALPMIIQAGIVDAFGSMKMTGDRQGAKNMQAVRCHILLAQEAGRNVLRELLIFIAAWDLPDDEFYFKMMVQIMEAILKNGLMSHAYSDFGQAKDIISPAQAVVIKILTHIFRSKYSPSSGQNGNEQPAARPKVIAALTRVDVLTVRYIFTVFRGNIIPETCALIYLQGQIRAGLAIAEDFPLNLWDMERVYEGVYQFLEFFAVLTENNDWKRLLVDWEIVYDLVTLLKELDASIPKAPLMPGSAATKGTKTPDQTTTTPPEQRNEKAHKVSGSPNEDNNDLVTQSNLPVNSSTPVPSEDPSTFEWRNLKKLIILVLSSLVWKNPTVQTQIRTHSGVETVLSCTNYDGYNPYIKEHAVMCLKFLLENNPDNQRIVQDLEARGVVNPEGLQKDFGVKARITTDGKIKIIPVDTPSTKVDKPLSSEKARRMARRASESNAAVELLGERFTSATNISASSSRRVKTATSGANSMDKGKGVASKAGPNNDSVSDINGGYDGDDNVVLGEEEEDDDNELEFM